MTALLQLDWRLFESLYDAFKRRSLVETLERRKEGMIAALWANSGFEGQEGSNARREAIMDLERHYDEAVRAIASGSFGQPEEEEELEDPYGFFEAGRRGMDKLETPRDDDGSVRANVEQQILQSTYTDQG